MGKKSKNKQQKSQPEETKVVTEDKNNEEHEEELEVAKSVTMDEINTTPGERAEEYKVSQMAQYDQFVAEFKDDQDYINTPLDFSDKEKELEMIRKQEGNKIERQVKKEINEWEELFAGNASLSKSQKGLNQLADKITKIIEGSVHKHLRKGLQAEEMRLQYVQNLESTDAAL